MLTTDETRTRGDATDEQRRNLRALIKERAVDPDWLHRFYDKVRRAEGLSRLTAVDALIYLRSLAPAGTHPDTATREQGETLKHLRRTRVIPTATARRMLKLHADGAMSYDRADLIIQEWLRLPYRDHPYLEGGPTLADRAPDGYFALMATDGTPRCYRIRTLPGSRTRIVHQITGDRPSQRRELPPTAAAQVMHQVAADVPAAARLHGTVRHHCSHCNQPLRDTTQPGYPHGYGRDCWDELQTRREADDARDG